MGSVEPPACIQNAMMTKDKKPFTYTPGGLDLSQIRTPSMARRLARQRSAEEQEQAFTQQNNAGYHPQGGSAPPPPPLPSKIPAPPPPPPIVIQVPTSKSPKPVAPGERPEIVIPENPIGMLRKTNSPYHWEAEKAELQRMGTVPKYTEKVPNPLTVKMPPTQFQQPQNYPTQMSNNLQRTFSNQGHPESPIHRPEAQYAKSGSSNFNGSPLTRELLQRQDSQFNKSPQPFAGQSPNSNSSPYSPTPNNNWRQPEKRDLPASNVNNSPVSPQVNRGPFSPNTPQYSPSFQHQSPSGNAGPNFHTLPRAGQRNQEPNNNVVYNNVSQQHPQENNTAPWRTNTLSRYPKETENQQKVNNNVSSPPLSANPPWKMNDTNNNHENSVMPPWKQENKPQQQYTPPWVNTQKDSNNNKTQESYSVPWRSQDSERSPPVKQEQARYQSTMQIPVTPRKQNSQPDYNNIPPQKEAVYVNQEPVYYCPESPKSVPPWVKTQKEKTKTPPPVWCQRPLDAHCSARELATPPRDNQEPEWVRKSNDVQRTPREVVSPPKYQQQAQPAWSTRPSENRKSLPKDNTPNSQGSRVIPIQMEVSSTETRGPGRQGGQQPQLRITIGMTPNNEQAHAPFSPPTQRIMRVLSPQLVRLDDGPPQHDLPTLSRTFSNQEHPKTRIIPIQIEGGSGGANKRYVI